MLKFRPGILHGYLLSVPNPLGSLTLTGKGETTMRKWIGFQILSAAILATGCCDSPKSWRLTPDGRSVPTAWGHSLPALGQSMAARPLRYDAVYVLELAKSDADSGAASWCRFWPSGQYHEWVEDHRDPGKGLPSAAEAEQFNSRGIGRYCAIGDRLIIQVIEPSEKLLCRVEYRKFEGKINEDGSFTWIIPQPGLPLTYRYMTFRPHLVGEMKRRPDW